MEPIRTSGMTGFSLYTRYPIVARALGLSLPVDQYNNHISNHFGGLQKFSQSNRSIQYVLNIILKCLSSL